MQIFAEVRYLCKRLRTAMTPGRDLWDTIAIVIALDTLHDDFDTTTASLLESGDKTIDQIQSILQSKEAKNISKRATGVTGDLAMAFRDSNGPKKKAYRDEEYFNCHKLGHFGRDCRQPDRRLARIGGPNTKGRTNNRSGSWTPHRANQTTENLEDSDDKEPFTPGPVGKACMAKEQLQKVDTDTWFLDSCASRHLCNNRKLFSNTKTKSIDFVTAAGQVIRTEEIGIVSIPLSGGNTIELHNVALIPGCNFNLISLGQLHESGITYHDNPMTMTLMRNGKVIAEAKREQNLFTLNLADPGKAMAVISPSDNIKHRAMAMTGRGHPTHLVSQSKRVQLWHRRLAHASNTRILRATKLVDGIKLDDDKEYDPAEILIDSDDSDTFDDEETRTQAEAGAITTALQATETDILDKICAPCVGSKSTRILRQNKSMTATTKKLEEVHADLWGPHDPPSQSGSIYAAILICEHTRKTWTLYLKGKDDFVDAFQAWLPRVENESGCSLQTFRADGGGEFISAKL